MLQLKTKKKKKKLTLEEIKEAHKIGLREEDVQEVEDPLFTARVNFETFKSIFKRDKKISKSKNGRISEDDMKITRYRESGSGGNVSKSVDSIRLKKTPASLRYKGMANRAYGVKAHEDGEYIYFNYDIETIEKDRKKQMEDE